MPSANRDFALYCCDLLATVGRCEAKRMFGGWGISSDGLTFALMTDLGQGDTLWLKADEDTKAQFQQAGCEQFTYDVQGEPKSMNYFAAPADAMESPALMAPWARLAFQAALKAQNAKLAKKPAVKRVAKAPVATKRASVAAKKVATKKATPKKTVTKARPAKPSTTKKVTKAPAKAAKKAAAKKAVAKKTSPATR